MLFRIIFILVVLIVVLVAAVPFTLNFFGTSLPGFASIGLGRLSGVSAKILIFGDEGKSWDEIEIVGDKDTVLPSVVFDLKPHPQNSTLIYLGTKGSGLWRSTNGGKSWSKLLDKSKILKSDADVYSVVASRSDPSVIYLAVFQDKRGRVLKSINGGQNFREIYFTPDGSEVFDLFVDPTSSSRVVIITGNGGLFKSLDGGNTWVLLQWLSISPAGFAVNPLNSDEIYIGSSSGGIFKTLDSGKNLEELKIKKNEEKGTSGDFSRQALDSNLWRDWEKVIGSASNAFFVNPENFHEILMGSGDGFTRSFDGGVSWHEIQAIIPPGTKIDAAAFYPKNSNKILVVSGGELYRTDDGGISWNVSVIPGRPRVRELIISPLKPQIIFAILGK